MWSRTRRSLPPIVGRAWAPPVAVTSKISLPTYPLRYTQSVRAKHLVWAYMGELRTYPT